MGEGRRDGARSHPGFGRIRPAGQYYGDPCSHNDTVLPALAHGQTAPAKYGKHRLQYNGLNQ
jgi:hypothetical protein